MFLEPGNKFRVRSAGRGSDIAARKRDKQRSESFSSNLIGNNRIARFLARFGRETGEAAGRLAAESFEGEDLRLNFHRRNEEENDATPGE